MSARMPTDGLKLHKTPPIPSGIRQGNWFHENPSESVLVSLSACRVFLQVKCQGEAERK